ncbi:MAG: hypothetical protein IT376_03395 [Polyangiaceae bacterium]|nr:hypothetical protein [Polyangiaceae bacterium]
MLGARPWWLLLAAAATGCFFPDEGLEAPLDRIYFPTGLALSPAGTRLYVASSDFDLQFTGGSLLALDLDRVHRLVPRSCEQDAGCAGDERCDLEPTAENGGAPSRWCVKRDGSDAGRPCGALGEQSAGERILHPGRCRAVDLARPAGGGGSLVAGGVGIGAFASDVIYRSRPAAGDGSERPGGRLFIPVRGDATLTFIDVDDDSKSDSTGFELECGQSGAGNRCDDDHRRGDDPAEENTRGQRLPPEPYGVDATGDGTAIVVTHQTEGAASLFVSDWGQNGELGSGPRLEFVLGGLPSRPVAVVAVPPSASRGAEPTYEPTFLVTSRSSAEVRLLSYFDDAAASPARPFLADRGGVAITANALGFDSRGIAVDTSGRRRAEAACAGEPEGDAREACLDEAANVALGVFVANRAPSSLLAGQTRPGSDLPRAFDAQPLSFGPSRVVVGEIIDRDGSPAVRVFVVCFDSRAIYVWDPVAREIEAVIETGRGPQPLVVDPRRGLGYVAHFTDSYVGVIDLDRRHPSYATIVLSVARPTPPRSSK